MGESAFDVLHGAFDGDHRVGCDEEMRVVRHDNEGVQMEVRAIVLERFEEELGVAVDLKEAAALVAGCGDEECSGLRGALRCGHRKNFSGGDEAVAVMRIHASLSWSSRGEFGLIRGDSLARAHGCSTRLVAKQAI